MCRVDATAGPVTRDGAALLRFVGAVVTHAQALVGKSLDGLSWLSEDPFLLDTGTGKPQAPWQNLDWDALAAAGATTEWVSEHMTGPGRDISFCLPVSGVLGTIRGVSHGITPAMQTALAEHGMKWWNLGADYAEVCRQRRRKPESPDVWARRFLDGREGLKQAGCLDGNSVVSSWPVAVDWALQITGQYGIPDRTMGRWAAALHWDYETDSAFEQAVLLDQWMGLVGADGWAWPAAGFTPDEARALLALPETDPGRPGPDQLAVMAALRAGV